MRSFAMLIMSVCSFGLSGMSNATEIKITGSVQFWQRQCSNTYVCDLPTANSPRIEIASLISEPEPGYSVSSTAVDFSYEAFAGKLSVYWNLNGGDAYLAGQSYLSKDGLRIAECSHFAKSDVKSFIPTGFCSGYVSGDLDIKQYGMTFYK